VETAGGVCSPGPSGTLQCELMRPMRLPAILVGDGNLGGISTTVSALDVLHARGYDVVAVFVADGGHGNVEAIRRYCDSVASPSSGTAAIPVFALPPVPERTLGRAPPWDHADRRGEDRGAFLLGGDEIFEWLVEGRLTFDVALGAMTRWHGDRVRRLRSSPKRARRDLWWPFTQHDLVEEDDVTVIDSRSGEDFGIHVPDVQGGGPGSIHLKFDGAASWWTQGVSRESQNRLNRALGNAAGRWGHVMFPENAHDAALDAARGLLDGAGRGWASRVFFSDNGSTAMEVAVKMAIRAWYVRQGLVIPGDDRARQEREEEKALPQVRVLALDGSYHGDTLGTMDMQAPSVFTGPLQTPWYEPRGLFLSPPTLQMRDGRWVVEQNAKNGVLCARKCSGCACGEEDSPSESTNETVGFEESIQGFGFRTRSEAFDVARRSRSKLAKEYRTAIEFVLDTAERNAVLDPVKHPPIAALVTESVLHGAGGMDLIDPLFQSVLIRICKERNVPVVLDEVFAGIWRLGSEGAWELLDVTPDIACYAKLFTGGLVPLAATVTTEEVFDAFRGNTKARGLLHGHSYTAYPAGCAVAAEALRLYKDPESNPNLRVIVSSDEAREDSKASGVAFESSASIELDARRAFESVVGHQTETAPATSPAGGSGRKLRLRDLWDEERARVLSTFPNVKGVTVIGCVLAVELQDSSGGAGGYNSTATKDIVRRLRRVSSIQARPLGNVLYLMCAPTTSVDRTAELMGHVTRELQAAAAGEDDEAW